MRDKNNTPAAGITLWSLLAVVFIVLKLTHVIDWPWLWVLAPIWIQAAIALVVISVLLIAALIKVKRR